MHAYDSIVNIATEIVFISLCGQLICAFLLNMHFIAIAIAKRRGMVKDLKFITVGFN